MGKTYEIPVVPAVLAWAREFRGLSLPDAAAQIGIPEAKLEGLEDGTEPVSLGLFRKIAKKYRLPPATLALPEPPAAPPPPTDYRTLDGKPAVLSLATHVAISRVREHQHYLASLAEDDRSIAAVKYLRHATARSPRELAKHERQRLKFSVGEQLAMKTPAHAFKAVRDHIESQGVYVYAQPIPLADCRGLSIADDGYPPAIVVSSKEEREEAKIFTLVHEYAHLLIGKPGISDENPTNPVEWFCNQFAAEFLMPSSVVSELLPKFEGAGWDIDTIRAVARRLKISQQALALQAEQIGLAPEGYYRRFLTLQTDVKPAKRKRKGGSYVNIQLSYLGKRYPTVVLNAHRAGRITSAEASRMLDLSPKHFPVVRQRMVAQGAGE